MDFIIGDDFRLFRIVTSLGNMCTVSTAFVTVRCVRIEGGLKRFAFGLLSNFYLFSVAFNLAVFLKKADE